MDKTRQDVLIASSVVKGLVSNAPTDSSQLTHYLTGMEIEYAINSIGSESVVLGLPQLLS